MLVLEQPGISPAWDATADTVFEPNSCSTPWRHTRSTRCNLLVRGIDLLQWINNERPFTDYLFIMNQMETR